MKLKLTFIVTKQINVNLNSDRCDNRNHIIICSNNNNLAINGI